MEYQAIQLIQLTPDQLEQLIINAVTKALENHQRIAADQPEQLSTPEAMKFTGYKNPHYFRLFIKANNIQPVAIIRRVRYYAKADLLKAGKPQQIKR
jgi:hypothetical protein